MPGSKPKSATANKSNVIKSDLLARAYLDILAREEGVHSRPMLRAGSGDPSDPVEILLDDLMDTPAEERVSVRPDLAAVAVLTARAVEAEPGLTRILRQGAPVVTITTLTPDRVASVRKVVEACALPGERSIVTGSRQSRPGRHETLIIARDGTEKGHKPDAGNVAVADALHARSTIIGIAPDPRRQLPRDLMRSAEFHLVLPEIDQSALLLVIEAVMRLRRFSSSRSRLSARKPSPVRGAPISTLTVAPMTTEDAELTVNAASSNAFSSFSICFSVSTML